MAAVTEEARDEQLAWEARQRPRAAIASIVSAILTLGGYLWAGVALRDAPSAGFLEALGEAGRDGPIGRLPSQKIAAYEYYQDNALTLIASGVVRALALLALGWVVTFIAAAVRARRPEFIRLAVYITLVGAVLYGISTVLGPIGTVLAINDFLDGPRTVDDSLDVGGSTLLITASLIGQLGTLCIVAGIFLVSLNAMRVGLLTRFLGILGIISAVLLVLPLMPLPVVQSFWLIGTGLLLLGVGRVGLPPAWRTGKAEPWPTAMEGAQRRRADEDRKSGIVRDEPKPEPAPAGRPHPASKKRKRKRRD